MPEVLGDAGVYFDPEDANSIAGALSKLIASPDLRAHMQARWTARCAAKTAAAATANAWALVLFELWRREYGVTF